eukprot:gene8437-2897_t
MSNSLFFERLRRWRGLLVEPNPALFARAAALNRAAWLTDACVATRGSPHVVRFSARGALGGIVEHLTHSAATVINRTCVPLPLLLQHAGAPKVVDFWSLDVEGAELPILRATLGRRDMPRVRVMVIENNDPAGLQKAMNSFGYVHVLLSKPLAGQRVQDQVYVHRASCRGRGCHNDTMLLPHFMFRSNATWSDQIVTHGSMTAACGVSSGDAGMRRRSATRARRAPMRRGGDDAGGRQRCDGWRDGGGRAGCGGTA